MLNSSDKSSASHTKKTKPVSLLKKRNEFLRLQRRGHRSSSPSLTAYIMRAKEGESSKIGYTVSKRIGNAPTRNLIKRRLRHIAVDNLSLWQGLLVSIVAKPKATEIAFSELSQHFKQLFEMKPKRRRGSR